MHMQDFSFLIYIVFLFCTLWDYDMCIGHGNAIFIEIFFLRPLIAFNAPVLQSLRLCWYCFRPSVQHCCQNIEKKAQIPLSAWPSKTASQLYHSVTKDLPTSGVVRDVCFLICSWEFQKLLWATSALTWAFMAPGPDTAVAKTTLMSDAVVDPGCVHHCESKDKQLDLIYLN